MSEETTLGELNWTCMYVINDERVPVAEFAVDDDRKFLIAAPLGDSEQAQRAAQSVLDNGEPDVSGRLLLATSDFDGIVHT